MYFADLFFLFFFLPICVGLYFISKNITYKNIVLIAFSLIFYAWGDAPRIVLLLFSAVLNYVFALLIAKRKHPKLWLGLDLVFNIGMLGFFKYTDFFIGNINSLFGLSIPLTEIILPLGISFFTFQIISYVIDVYWEKVDVQRNFSKLLLYISLFPQLVSGPIVRYSTIASEIDNRKTTLSDMSSGLTRIIVGLSKKVLLANNLNLLAKLYLTDQVANASVAGTWIGIIAYSMQVYFDFSGYSDMAIGIGRIFGFHFDENFNYPFVCRSIQEFWQRWHISLGSFFRDYLLYVPLFGKRRQTISLFLVWFTTGLWHGASWNFVIWGLYFGVFIFIETKIGKKRLKKVPTVIMHLYSKLVIAIGFGIFYYDTASLGGFFKNLFGFSGIPFINKDFLTGFNGVNIKTYLFVFLVSLAVCIPILPALKKLAEKLGAGVKAGLSVASTAACSLMMFDDTAVLVETFATNNPFLYWNF